MAVIESPVFPLTTTFPQRFGPSFDVDIVETDSGQEWRTINRSQPKQKAHIVVSAMTDANMAVLREWMYVAFGPAIPFRVRDVMDYKVPDNSGTGGLTLLSGSAGTAGAVYQMEKWYVRGSTTFKRTIVKPTVGATEIYDSGPTLKLLTTDYTLDESTGHVTLVTSFTPASWRGTFENLMRFDIDENMFSAIDWGGDGFLQSMDEIPLIEVPFP